jgi:hypothetical protein
MKSPAAPGASTRALIGIPLAALLILLLAFGPIQQPAGYHDFADQRRLLGIPHFWNLVSNLPFLAIGLMGLGLLRRKPAGAALPWAAVFGGTALVALGSSYYHMNPSDTTLVWDRIPIGIAFMGLLAALFAEHTGQEGKRCADWLLLPLMLFSVGTVYWWRFTGDLAPWIWVQVAPMLGVALMLAYLPGRYTHRRYLAYALAFYAAAKLCEVADLELLHWTAGVMGGHALKHFAAAAGVWCFYVMLRDRSSVAGPPGTSDDR